MIIVNTHITYTYKCDVCGKEVTVDENDNFEIVDWLVIDDYECVCPKCSNGLKKKVLLNDELKSKGSKR